MSRSNTCWSTPDCRYVPSVFSNTQRNLACWANRHCANTCTQTLVRVQRDCLKTLPLAAQRKHKGRIEPAPSRELGKWNYKDKVVFSLESEVWILRIFFFSQTKNFWRKKREAKVLLCCCDCSFHLSLAERLNTPEAVILNTTPGCLSDEKKCDP